MMKLEIIGNLGADAEKRTENGQSYILFSVADTDSYTKADGSKVENTTWVNCILNGDGGNLLPYLKKGTKVFVRGRQSLRVFSSAKDKMMKAGVDLNVREIELVGGKAEDVPGELVDEQAVVHRVYKAYYITPDEKGQFPAGKLMPTRGTGLYTLDSNGFIKAVVTPTQEVLPPSEDAAVTEDIAEQQKKQKK